MRVSVKWIISIKGLIAHPPQWAQLKICSSALTVPYHGHHEPGTLDAPRYSVTQTRRAYSRMQRWSAPTTRSGLPNCKAPHEIVINFPYLGYILGFQRLT